MNFLTVVVACEEVKFLDVEVGNPEIGHIFVCGAITSGPVTNWMVPRDSGHRMGPGWDFFEWCDCGRGMLNRDIPLLWELWISKIRDILACGAGPRKAMVEWMLSWDSAHQIGRVWDSQQHSSYIGNVWIGELSVMLHLENAKIGDTFPHGSSPRRAMIKRIAWGELAHQIL